MSRNCISCSSCWVCCCVVAAVFVVVAVVVVVVALVVVVVVVGFRWNGTFGKQVLYPFT